MYFPFETKVAKYIVYLHICIMNVGKFVPPGALISARTGSTPDTNKGRFISAPFEIVTCSCYCSSMERP